MKLKSEHQAEVTRGWIKRFEATLQELENTTPTTKLEKACRDAVVSQLESLREELAEWEAQ